MAPSTISSTVTLDYKSDPSTVHTTHKFKLAQDSLSPEPELVIDNKSQVTENTSLYTVPTKTTIVSAENSEKEGPTLNKLPIALSENLAYNMQTAYQLTPDDADTSFEQYELEAPDRYRIRLHFTKHEIEMIRYTWNKMLLEENKSSRNMPGGFGGDDEKKLRRQSMKGLSTTPRQTTTSLMASSLFCRQLYSNLLTIAPELELLWPSLKHQAVSFAQVMQMTIANLEDLSVLDSFYEKLGKSHARIFGIEPPAYEIMGEALVQTFNERFGSRFTIELEVLWIKLFLYMANSILQFGLDPVLRLHRTGSRQSSVSTVRNQSTSSNSIFAADPDINSTLDKKLTNATSVASGADDFAQPPKIDAKGKSRFRSHRGSISYNGDLASVSEKSKQKNADVPQQPKKPGRLDRLRKKKGDCVIM